MCTRTALRPSRRQTGPREQLSEHRGGCPSFRPQETQGTVSGNEELSPGPVLTLPEPGRARHPSLWVIMSKAEMMMRLRSQGDYGESRLINAKVFRGCLVCCWCPPNICYFQEQGVQTP